MQENGGGRLSGGAQDTAERRAAQRRRVLKGATVRFNRGYGVLECVVRNLSETGARLAFGETSGVPSRFEVRLSGSDEWLPAETRWRNMTDIGVAFRALR